MAKRKVKTDRKENSGQKKKSVYVNVDEKVEENVGENHGENTEEDIKRNTEENAEINAEENTEEYIDENTEINAEGDAEGHTEGDNVEENNEEMSQDKDGVDRVCDGMTAQPDDAQKNKYYEVIGKEQTGRLKRLPVPLPEWIINNVAFPKDLDVIQSSDEYAIDSLSSILNNSIIETLKKKGFDKFFPVQRKLIPIITSALEFKDLFRPRDLCISSPTGSGKTLAFVIPMVNHLLKRISTQLRAIIILPVRDLAQQVYRVVQEFTAGTRLVAVLSIGHKSLEDDFRAVVKQDKDGNYRSVADILVTTPSRILSFIDECPGFSLKYLEMLILDEVDRVMDFEYEYNWYREIHHCYYGRNNVFPCQCSARTALEKCAISNLSGCYLSSYNNKTRSFVKLLFSATLTKDVTSLHCLNLFYPQFFYALDEGRKESKVEALGRKKIEIAERDFIPETLKEKFILTTSSLKPQVLWYLIAKLGLRKVLIFTYKRKYTMTLQRILSKLPGLRVFAFGSQLMDQKRKELLRRFNGGDWDVIISTDIMARGMDINNIQYVVSYDKPRDEVEYVHRVGRTARAGQEGTAITILEKEKNEFERFLILMRKVHTKAEIEKMKKMDIHTRELRRCKKDFLKHYFEAGREVKHSKLRQDNFKKNLLWSNFSSKLKKKKVKKRGLRSAKGLKTETPNNATAGSPS